MSSWLSPVQVAAHFNVSVTTVNNLVNKGRLHRRYTKDGLVRYDPREIEELEKTYQPAPKRPGSGRKIGPSSKGVLEAEIVLRLRRNIPPADIVVQLRCGFADVDRCMRWLKVGADDEPISLKEQYRKMSHKETIQSLKAQAAPVRVVEHHHHEPEKKRRRT